MDAEMGRGKSIEFPSARYSGRPIPATLGVAMLLNTCTLSSSIFKRFFFAIFREQFMRYVTQKIQFGIGKSDRDRLVNFVSARPAVTVTAEQFEMVQYVASSSSSSNVPSIHDRTHPFQLLYANGLDQLAYLDR